MTDPYYNKYKKYLDANLEETKQKIKEVLNAKNQKYDAESYLDMLCGTYQRCYADRLHLGLYEKGFRGGKK